jgi:hypothetical protein
VGLVSVDAEPVDAIIDFELHLGLKVADGLESAFIEGLESQRLRSLKSVADGTYNGHKSRSGVDVATHVLLVEADLQVVNRSFSFGMNRSTLILMAGWVVGKLAKAGTSSFWSAMVLDEGDAGSLGTTVFTWVDLMLNRRRMIVRTCLKKLINRPGWVREVELECKAPFVGMPQRRWGRPYSYTTCLRCARAELGLTIRA